MTNYDQKRTKTRNRKNVIEYISSKGSAFRKEICDELGSSLTTVLEITEYLQNKGIIKLTGSAKTERGRYPKIIEYVPASMTSIAISYYGTYAKAALCDSYGQIIKYYETETASTPKEFFENNLPQIYKRFNSKKYNILGVGICMPGDFSADGDIVALSPFSYFENENELKEFNREFSKKIGKPLYFFNDGNASAYGEYLARGKKEDNLAFIYVGEGLGAGLVLDGNLRFGRNCTAGEIGYLVFDPEFQSTLSKPGWLENHLAKKVLDSITDKKERIEYIGNSIAIAIANVCNILDIGLVVLDGKTIKEERELLLSYINKKIESLCFNSIKIESPILEHPDISGTATLVIAQELENYVSD